MKCRIEGCARERVADSNLCRQHLAETWKYGHAEPIRTPAWLQRARENGFLAKELSR